MLFRLTLILMLVIGPGPLMGSGGLVAVSALAAGGDPVAMSCGPDGSCCCALSAACGCAIDAPARTPAPEAPAPAPTQRPDLSAPLERDRAALPGSDRPAAAHRWSAITADRAWSESCRSLWNVWRT